MSNRATQSTWWIRGGDNNQNAHNKWNEYSKQKKNNKKIVCALFFIQQNYQH